VQAEDLRKMQDLISQEQFEMEVLDRLNSMRFLQSLIFGGGTMLRLCHGLDRYSVDLDFWLTDPSLSENLFADMKSYLARFYKLRDAASKHFSLLFELGSASYVQNLKIEIRKNPGRPETETAIAYSPHSNRQVLVRAMTLNQMMMLKTLALLERGEIRDAYDIEFIVKRGIPLQAETEVLAKILRCIDRFTKVDYSSKLGSLLEPEKRAYYREQNFRILKAEIQDRMKPDRNR
jgi:predicted nucleotidyltransferase component of viral defense system